MNNSVNSGTNSLNNEKVSMIQAANTLLNSVTKVLLLADVVIINQILNSKNKVCYNLYFHFRGLTKSNEHLVTNPHKQF